MKKVFLVGAGPGAADLLTLRAARVLQSADVVLYDALVSREVLALTKSSARLINVGKRCGKKLFGQEEINRLMVSLASSSDSVVRLKGGDPLIFGRAAEEMRALREAGIDFEVIPGVTAASSAAATAKISLTDRESSSRLLLTTAHHSSQNQDRPLATLQDREQSLVVYMPGRDHAALQDQLLRSGVAPDTPCLIVSRISLPEEEVVATTVGSLDQASPLRTPSVVIVGEVARQAPSTTLHPELEIPRFGPEFAVAEVRQDA